MPYSSLARYALIAASASTSLVLLLFKNDGTTVPATVTVGTTATSLRYLLSQASIAWDENFTGAIVVSATGAVYANLSGSADGSGGRGITGTAPTTTTGKLIGADSILGEVPEDWKELSDTSVVVRGSLPVTRELQAGEFAVSNGVLRIGGATNGTAANPYAQHMNRWINVTNTSSTLRLYIKRIAYDTVLLGAMSITSFDTILEPMDSASFFVPAGKDLAGLRSTTSTDKVRFVEDLAA